MSQLMWMMLGLLVLMACSPSEPPKAEVVLPLAEDQPTFLWFFTDP